jgi:hypothetical protein
MAPRWSRRKTRLRCLPKRESCCLKTPAVAGVFLWVVRLLLLEDKRRLQYFEGALDRGLQTGMAMPATSRDRRSAECPCGVFRPTFAHSCHACCHSPAHMPYLAIKKPAWRRARDICQDIQGEEIAVHAFTQTAKRSARNGVDLPELSVSPVAVSTVCGPGIKPDTIAGYSTLPASARQAPRHAFSSTQAPRRAAKPAGLSTRLLPHFPS